MGLQSLKYENVNILDSKILQLVVNQLNRDVSLCGFDKEFEATDLDLLFADLVGWIEHLLGSEGDVILNLLYRIDVSQSVLSGGSESVQEHVAIEVLKRELQKIVLRQKFSD